MGAFFIYILKSSVCLVLFYLFFRLLLSKETFHRFNRVALLGVLFLSLLIPFIEVTTNHQVEVQQTVLTIEQLLMMAEMESTAVDAAGVAVNEAASFSWIEIVLLVYLAGIIFLACRNLYSLFCLFRLIHSGKREKLENGVTLVVHEQEIAPFSWMKYIVISQKDLRENGREILIHEAAHIRHRHSIDLLLADICIFFQWFNPGAWLLKQELQNIHEYEADETVINEGVNAKEYQLLLIKKAVGTRLYSMANSFNHSKLKKRITMMLKEKSNPWARLKYLYVLPLAAIAVTAFARPEVSEKVEEISVVKVNDLANYMQENVLGDAVNVLQDTVKVSHSGSKTDINAEERTAKTKDDEEMIIFEVVEQMPEYPGGIDALKKYLKDKVDSSNMKGKAGGRVIVGFTVDETGKVKDVQVLQSDQSVLNKEAERIVNGMPAWIPGKQRGVPVSVKYSVPVRFGDIRFPENKKPLIMVDGKEVSMDDFEKIDRDIIESVSVLKDSASIKVHGKRGVNGMILVTTKKPGTTSQFKFSKVDNQENVVPDFQVTGTVVDEQGRPKPGVSIIVPNTTSGAISDVNGHFSLKAVKGGNLLFSFIGYKSMKVPVTATMSVRMEQEVVNLLPETTSRLIRVRDTKPTGLINGITVHGVKEGEQPLVIVDGKEALEKDALSKIAPDHIKSITILKDKPATAVYGDKAKDGVIIVEMMTDEDFQAMKNNRQLNYANAWQLAESTAKDMEGEVIYLLDGKEVTASKLEQISAKTIKSASADRVDGKIVIRLVSEK
ncbi:TonB family protein [Bacteroides faecium]|uniref:TonB family protein n=1 Tax=Bacteroides faecium TaxID=2715212 RepID=UPI00350FCB29